MSESKKREEEISLFLFRPFSACYARLLLVIEGSSCDVHIHESPLFMDPLDFDEVSSSA